MVQRIVFKKKMKRNYLCKCPDINNHNALMTKISGFVNNTKLCIRRLTALLEHTE